MTDGGLANPVPDEVVRKMGADVVIGVNLENGHFKDNFKQNAPVTDILERAIAIMRHHLATKTLNPGTIVIEPEIDNQILLGFEQFFDKKQLLKNIKAGEEATEKQIRKIKKALS